MHQGRPLAITIECREFLAGELHAAFDRRVNRPVLAHVYVLANAKP